MSMSAKRVLSLGIVLLGSCVGVLGCAEDNEKAMTSGGGDLGKPDANSKPPANQADYVKKFANPNNDPMSKAKNYPR